MSIAVQQACSVRYADQYACAVKQVHQEKHENHGNHATIEQAVEVHLHERGRERWYGRHNAFNFG